MAIGPEKIYIPGGDRRLARRRDESGRPPSLRGAR
jgi:hypothetical protein